LLVFQLKLNIFIVISLYSSIADDVSWTKLNGNRT
jgi:hypothetical protein